MAAANEAFDLSKLTEDQTEALESLKQRLDDEKRSCVRNDLFLLHWLRARKFDVDKSEAMLRNHLRYRDCMDLDNTTLENVKMNPIFYQFYTQGNFGHDRYGHPLVFLPYGNVDPKGILSSMRCSEVLQLIIYSLDNRRRKCEENSEKFGHPVEQVIYIMDLKGIGTKHLWATGLEAFQEIARLVEAHTPEIVYRVYILNAPAIFPIIYQLVKPVIDERTANKVHIFSDHGWKEALLEIAEPDQLPEYYGGTARSPDGDPKCSHTIRYGGEVPKEAYFVDTVLSESTVPQDLHVARGRDHRIPVRIEKPGSILKWYFKSTGHDIGFGIYRLTDNSISDQPINEMTMVYPHFRISTYLVPEFGELNIQEPGTYVFHLDNTYSRWHGKQFKYHVEVIEPNN